ncbi:MAG: hypothetical protein ACOYKA_04440 [Legionellaceae bacterium]
MIHPTYRLFYGPGGPGGYGENLRASHTGYHGFSPEGIEKLIELQGLNVPLIKTSQDFQTLIQSTPLGSQKIALLMHDPVILGCEPSNYIYAVVYEKHSDQDRLFIYDSGSQLADYRDYFASYFREKFCLMFPDKQHVIHNEGSYEDFSNANAMEDVAVLLSQPDKPLRSFNPNTGTFHLSPAFDYDEQEIRRKSLCQLIAFNEAQRTTPAPACP